jgi:hypothetical protein
MAFELVPPDSRAQAVAEAALALAGVETELVRAADGGGWLVAARAEAVDRDPRGDESYALSPRSTRGATRA